MEPRSPVNWSINFGSHHRGRGGDQQEWHALLRPASSQPTTAWGMKLYNKNYLLLSTYMISIKYKNVYYNFMPGQAQLLQTWMNKNVIRLLPQAIHKTGTDKRKPHLLLILNWKHYTTSEIKAKVATFGFGGPTEVLLVATYAFKLYASACLNIRRIGLVKKGEKLLNDDSFHLHTIGSQIVVKIVKNKHAQPFKTSQFELEFGKWICHSPELFEQNFWSSCSCKTISWVLKPPPFGST
ncbi:hypothetical protein ZEAMMB73_Zm00001d042348 [Zea mays]|uniref:RecA family profile 2 domain-containing protein n=1 Tax=Zea mays TaxID=4577 RepID=A0A1D6N349_MAIZE|nr:hypothetical protein ZEAMMB73_Zm00001d042348 [Zea mays]